MAGNPIADEKGEEFKKEILILLMDELTCLKSVNENPITPEDIEEVKTEKERKTWKHVFKEKLITFLMN